MTAVYETIRVKGGTLPLLDRHLARLERNSRAVGLLPPPGDLAKLLLTTAGTGARDRMLRVEWDGAELEVDSRALPSLAPVRLITSSETHPGYIVKTTDRKVFDRAREEAQSRGADDALLLTSDGFVAEGTLFAIGWFEGERMKLPSLDLGILPSVSRGRVLELAGEIGIETEEGRFRLSELDGRAAWIATAVRGVVPVASLDGVPMPMDERTKPLKARFWLFE